MAPLPTNLTSVLFVDYSVAGEAHTLQCRFLAPGTLAGAKAAVEAVFTAASGSLFDLTITAARFRNQASTVTLPTDWTGGTSFGGVAGVHTDTANYADFVGRSVEGRRVRVALFGWNTIKDSSQQDYRYQNTGDVAAVLAVLNATTDVFLAIDGAAVIWKSYANGGINAYWRNKIR